MEYIVNTPCGAVKGCAGKTPGTVAYKGIRYATAGRWEYPTLITGWDGVYDATQYGACGYQPRSFYNEGENKKKYFYYNEFRKGETYTYSEDCLFLNVFTPADAKPGDKLPVLFYIHGGGFTGGCGHEKHFDGPVWPLKGVIGVTVNYRLGPMGFIALPQLKEEAGYTGNYGLFDQMTAMQWVRDNISAFGGDPDNMTIMGQSAGAMSVQQHVLSPLTKGLFKRAVMSSGGGISKILSAKPCEEHYAFWQAVMTKAGCDTLEQFRAVEPENLFSAWQAAQKEQRGGIGPCIDGRLVVGTGTEILSAGKQHHIPYMAGATSEDMMPPILQSMADKWCKAQPKDSYVWHFDRRLPGDENGAWHSSDLWYWFGTIRGSWRPVEKKDDELAELMCEYLCNFVKTGDPNGAGLPTWTPAQKSGGKVMRMGEKQACMTRLNKFKLLYTMLTNKAVGE